MGRRTKEASQATRRSIIDAAREVFDRHGVAHTSMEDIAAAAGVTRGAIYWHFANKADLFNAMRDEVHLPLVHLSDLALDAADEAFDPLDRVENFLAVVIDHVGGDAVVEQTFRIATFKCEYVDEFAGDLDLAARKHSALQVKLAKVYRQAQRKRLMRVGLSPSLAATDTIVFLSGLVRLWLFDDEGTLVRKHARQLIAEHVASRRHQGETRAGTRASTRTTPRVGPKRAPLARAVSRLGSR